MLTLRAASPIAGRPPSTASRTRARVRTESGRGSSIAGFAPLPSPIGRRPRGGPGLETVDRGELGAQVAQVWPDLDRRARRALDDLARLEHAPVAVDVVAQPVAEGRQLAACDPLLEIGKLTGHRLP